MLLLYESSLNHRFVVQVLLRRTKDGERDAMLLPPRRVRVRRLAMDVQVRLPTSMDAVQGHTE